MTELLIKIPTYANKINLGNAHVKFVSLFAGLEVNFGNGKTRIITKRGE